MLLPGNGKGLIASATVDRYSNPDMSVPAACEHDNGGPDDPVEPVVPDCGTKLDAELSSKDLFDRKQNRIRLTEKTSWSKRDPAVDEDASVKWTVIMKRVAEKKVK